MLAEGDPILWEPLFFWGEEEKIRGSWVNK